MSEKLKLRLAYVLLGFFIFLGFAAVMEWMWIIDTVGKVLYGPDVVLSPISLVTLIALGWWLRGKSDARRNRSLEHGRTR